MIPQGRSTQITISTWPVGAVFAANGVVIGAWSVRIAEVQRAHGLSDGGLGLALICVGVGALIAMPPTAILVTRFGSVFSIRVLIVVLAAAPALAAISPGILTLMLSLAALGAGNGGLDIGMNTQAVALERERRAPVMSTLHAVFSVGFLLSALIGGWLAALGVSTGVHLAAVGAAVAVAALVGSRHLVPDRPEPGGSILPRVPTRELAVLGIIAFCALFTEGAIVDWGSVFVTGTLSGSPLLAGAAAAGFGAGMALSRLSGDRLRTRFGPVRLIHLGGATIGLAMALALVSRSHWTVVPCFLLVGLGLGNCFPLILAAAGSRVRRPQVPAAVASVSALGYTGFLLGPALIGLVAEATSLSLSLSLVVVAAAAVVLMGREVGIARPGGGRSDA